jgi:hypothetical protein
MNRRRGRSGERYADNGAREVSYDKSFITVKARTMTTIEIITLGLTVFAGLLAGLVASELAWRRRAKHESETTTRPIDRASSLREVSVAHGMSSFSNDDAS